MSKADRQVDITSASFRMLYATPGHVTYGVWINGAKCGDLTVRQEERVGFDAMMQRGGFAMRQGGFMLISPQAEGTDTP